MGKEKIILALVNSFAERPFEGNPAGVCILHAPADAVWMQHIAREVNHAETAFLFAEPDGWNLRWFTPEVEVDLCGHATLAAAHILWERHILEHAQEAHFHTKSGLLLCCRVGEWTEMDFPADPEQPLETDPGLAAALQLRPQNIVNGKFDYLLEVESEREVRQLAPDLDALAALPGRGVCVTSRADPGKEYDFVSRFFAPAIGIPEDSVTGSAHCMLAPYWARRTGKTELVGYQCSSRGGYVRARLSRDRVILGGKAVTIAIGEVADSAHPERT